jgi:F0F1-type ATP synthase membrane subunit b/b'
MADADTDAKPVDQDTLVTDIDRTRMELARTIDAISDRVSPKKNVARTMEQVRQRADQTMEQARKRADQTMEQARKRADQSIEQARKRADQSMEQARKYSDQSMEQVRQRVSQIDPVMAGVAAAAVVVSVTALLLWRRRSR